jgi:hypothetical protein
VRRALIPVLLLLFGSGCHSYTYWARGPGLSRVAIDENAPHEETRWSVWWGAHQDVWEPYACQDANGNMTVFSKTVKQGDPIPPECAKAMYPLCDGNGAVGRVEVTGRWYTVPVMLFTLGIVQPMRVKAWCATQQGPGGPIAHAAH